MSGKIYLNTLCELDSPCLCLMLHLTQLLLQDSKGSTAVVCLPLVLFIQSGIFHSGKTKLQLEVSSIKFSDDHAIWVQLMIHISKPLMASLHTYKPFQ